MQTALSSFVFLVSMKLVDFSSPRCYFSSSILKRFGNSPVTINDLNFSHSQDYLAPANEHATPHGTFIANKMHEYKGRPHFFFVACLFQVLNNLVTFNSANSSLRKTDNFGIFKYSHFITSINTTMVH